MLWTAWNNGQHLPSGGYGFKITPVDRNNYFKHSWKTVIVELPKGNGSISVEVNVAKKSFWTRTCGELIHKDIGQWLRESGYAPWRPWAPPTFEVKIQGDRSFVIR